MIWIFAFECCRINICQYIGYVLPIYLYFVLLSCCLLNILLTEIRTKRFTPRKTLLEFSLWYDYNSIIYVYTYSRVFFIFNLPYIDSFHMTKPLWSCRCCVIRETWCVCMFSHQRRQTDTFITTARRNNSLWGTGITVIYITHDISREIYSLICFAILYLYHIISSIWTIVIDLPINMLLYR